MSALLNFHSFLIIVLLFICTSTFVRQMRPQMVTNDPQAGFFRKMLYKGSVVGTRLSPWVSLSCMVMAVTVLFF